ncbi:hypothetical protein TEA_014322 [Camellia sinensis var. sinensis]|uniref:Receptor-like serine/threonine-protein kinase n=1 Tax=Camellia sinensis var. sinensis TaxID=542762 RepID=A0A4S4EDA5_CAMSN|nr:hypothetical protein TEA_014322 [Camellia sinensis var. sinensis]
MNPEKWVFGAILLLLVLFFGLGNSTDTITPTRPIKDDDILVSDGETFTLGFFSTKNETSNRRYVGIWYNKISEQTVVWVANRDNPINGSSGAISINQDGNLVIYEHNSQNNITTTLWQTNVSTSSSYSAQLLDSGNLMLLFQVLDIPELQSLRRASFLRLAAFVLEDSPPAPFWGIHFLVNPLICEFLWRTGLAPTQVSTNTYRIINGIHELNNRLGTNLGLAEILRQYTLGHTGDGLAYYLKIKPGKKKIVTGTPDKDLHDDDFFWVSGNYETTDVPGWFISKNFSDTSIEALQANYHYPNEAAIRTVLRYRNRDCHELLGYVPTYRYSAPCRSKVTDFLCAPSPPPNPTLPDVPFIRLTEAKEMAKRSRIKNLITATSTELPSIPTRTAAAGQSSETVVALASPAAGQASKDNRQARKRPRADPSVKLVAELNTEQPAVTTDPTPTWRPQLKHRGKEIPATASVKGDKEHLLAFDLTKALLLPSDVVGNDHVPDTWLVKSSVKSMTRAIQKQHLVLERIHRLRQKATDSANQVEQLHAELGRSKASLQMANSDNSRLLGQLGTAEKERDALRAELETLKESNKKELEDANNAGGNIQINDEEKVELPIFDIVTISRATNKFCDANKIGEGGFGPVYKGLLSTGKEIAVKQFSTTSKQGLNEFKSEVTLVAKLQHRNLVMLLGCCIHGEERMDLKASNVLLDCEMNPKISNFGLARTFGGDQSSATTRRVVGTYGYMSPEYVIDGLFSIKSDIFSFGVIILEILSGKSNRRFHHPDHDFNLLGHAWTLWIEGKACELLDPLVEGSFSMSEVLRFWSSYGFWRRSIIPKDKKGGWNSVSFVDLVIEFDLKVTLLKGLS